MNKEKGISDKKVLDVARKECENIRGAIKDLGQYQNSFFSLIQIVDDLHHISAVMHERHAKALAGIELDMFMLDMYLRTLNVIQEKDERNDEQNVKMR